LEEKYLSKKNQIKPRIIIAAIPLPTITQNFPNHFGVFEG